MRMFKQMKWGALLALTLGYVVSNATVGETQPSVDKDKTEASAQRWNEVDVAGELPACLKDMRPNVINRANSLTHVFDVLCKSSRPLRVLQLGDSHVAGGSYPKAIRQTLEDAWGVGTDSTENGVIYRYYGKNGATVKHFATAERMAQVAEAKPDLIILSFGTNECHSLKYDETEHHAMLEELLAMLTATCPEAVIMMTTPPGDCLVKRHVRYLRRKKGRRRRRVVHSVSQINPMTVRCAAELERFGMERGLPVWDLNTIAGGADAVRNWTAGGFMRPDKVHFTPEGYTIQGNLLGRAILSAYNEYIKTITGGQPADIDVTDGQNS